MTEKNDDFWGFVLTLGFCVLGMLLVGVTFFALDRAFPLELPESKPWHIQCLSVPDGRVFCRVEEEKK